MEGTGCRIGLSEIVIKQPLLGAELERVRAVYPIHAARIVVQRMRKGRIDAALCK
jgi:hypothetical protein